MTSNSDIFRPCFEKYDARNATTSFLHKVGILLSLSRFYTYIPPHQAVKIRHLFSMKLTWTLIMGPWTMVCLYQPVIFRVNVGLQGVHFC